jgi:hypothetical protein
MTQKFVAKQHQLLDLLAESINNKDFANALQLFYKVAVNCNSRKLKFNPHTGYCSVLFANSMQTLNAQLISQNSEQALAAQTAVYEMLDVLM